MKMENSKMQNPQMALMVTIVNRGSGERAASIIADAGFHFHLLTLAKGTADTKLLDYLGLGETDKDLIISMMPLEATKNILELLDTQIQLHKSGHGIAFTIPIRTIGSSLGVHDLRDSLQAAQEENKMLQNKQYELIVTVSNRGYTDDVMEAARSAQATGGTAIHARQVGVKEAESLFGVTIQPEKEIILILTLQENRDAIIQAIMERAGLQTKAKSIAFSLPVSDVAGLA